MWYEIARTLANRLPSFCSGGGYDSQPRFCAARTRNLVHYEVRFPALLRVYFDVKIIQHALVHAGVSHRILAREIADAFRG